MANPTPLQRQQTGYRLPAGKWFNDIIDRINGLIAGTLSLNVNANSFALTNYAGGLTARAGGTQALALALTATVNRVTVVATAADSVRLPAPTVIGQQVTIINSAANSLTAYGAGTDTINSVATATGVALAGGKTGVYTASSIGTAANWTLAASA